MKLSLCIATYNEEESLHHALDSAAEMAEEVIIVDGSSTDKTIEVARSYGKKIKVIETDNPQIFHINKQKAIEAAQGEWILQLDADEELSPELKEEIKAIISNDKSDIVAYWLPRKNFFLTRFLEYGGQYPDYTIRLYKRGVAHFPCKSVHENVDVKGNIAHAKNPLLHYADPNFDRYLTRWNRYTSLDAKFLLEEKKQPSFFSYFVIKPKLWFLSTYFRHKGFRDGFPGFVFALFSALRFQAIYIKWWAATHKKQ